MILAYDKTIQIDDDLNVQVSVDFTECDLVDLTIGDTVTVLDINEAKAVRKALKKAIAVAEGTQ